MASNKNTHFVAANIKYFCDSFSLLSLTSCIACTASDPCAYKISKEKTHKHTYAHNIDDTVYHLCCTHSVQHVDCQNFYLSMVEFNFSAGFPLLSVPFIITIITIIAYVLQALGFKLWYLLDWAQIPTLKTRRTVAKLVLFVNISVHTTSSLPETRIMDSRLCNYDPDLFYLPISKTKHFMSSFFYDTTIMLWDSLPPEVRNS